MLSIFDFTNYREYLSKWIASRGSRAYGLKGRLAQALGVSSSLISQILKGEKALTPDQTSDLCDFLNLTELEADYLHLLVEHNRAGNSRYRQKLERKIQALQTQSRKLGKRVPRDRELNDEQKAIYYSNWLYTGIRNLTAVPGCDQVDSIAERLKMDPSVIQRTLRFLIDHGLCREENGRVTYGPAGIHVDKESPYVTKHHQNWRLRGIHQMEMRRENDIFFTAPMSLSHAAAEEVRKLLPSLVQTIMKITSPSPSETVACLNFDWFEY